MMIQCISKIELFITNLKFCSESSLENNWSCLSFGSNCGKLIAHQTTVHIFQYANTRTVLHGVGSGGRCLECNAAANEHARRACSGAGVGPDTGSVHLQGGLEASAPLRCVVTSSGRRADSGWRGGPRGGAPVNRRRWGEFNGTGGIPGLEFPKEFFVGSAQPLLLLGLLLHILLEIGVLLRQLPAPGRRTVSSLQSMLAQG